MEVAVDHDAVEAVIYKNKKLAKQLSEHVHRTFHTERRAPVGRRTIRRRPGKTPIAGKDFRLAEEIE
jgi:hypothetical protein